MDIFSAKFVFLAVVALVVLGPERLPQALRTGGRLLGEVRRIAAQAQLDSQTVLDHTGLAEHLAELRSLGQAITAPVSSLRDELHHNLRLSPLDISGPRQGTGANGPAEVVATSSTVLATADPAGPVEPSDETQERLELSWP